jgi:acyl-[acyl-carrier-protein]-phospholipid O-acyltransferase/long-chain-fatty-acid--[acyl-carrier-protein] ligase
MLLKRFLLQQFFKLLRVSCNSQIPLQEIPSKAIFVANHVSFLDPILAYAFLPQDTILVLNSFLLRRKYIRFLLRGARVIEFNPIDPKSIREVLQELEQGQRCLIFPEGRLTKSGSLMKIYEAPGILADKADAPIVPVWISGAEYSYFSILTGKVPQRPIPKITITIGKPVPVKMREDMRHERDYISITVYRLMLEMNFRTHFQPKLSLFAALVKSAKIFGKTSLLHRFCCLEDQERKPMTYKDLLIKSLLLGNYFNRHFQSQEHVGLLMPNSCASLCSFFGLVAYNKVSAILNFSSGTANVVTMCRSALISNILTSRKFIEMAQLQDLVQVLVNIGIQIFYLEDIARTFTWMDKIQAYLQYKRKWIPYREAGENKCVILFTSGSEGTPKAVILTHANLNANVLQCKTMIDINNTDTIFNVLPMFHSFGLTVGTIFPLLVGGKVFLYTSPLHYRIIPEIVYEIGATAMFATDTFFRGYSKIAHPYDFNSIRFILGGAEAVKQDTRNIWSERFGVRLLEGYGTTECSPVLAANNLVFCKFGSIGQLLPGIEYKFKKIEGISRGGELCVKGPNIMKGYFNAQNSGEIVTPEDGWYETGDVGYVDDIGYFFITDRLKRFAKIGGEMVSLTAVENMVEKCYSWMQTEFQYAVVAISHETKGEQLVLITNNRSVKTETLQTYIKSTGVSELLLPKTILLRDDFPLLANGKRNNTALRQEILRELGGNDDLSGKNKRTTV